MLVLFMKTQFLIWIWDSKPARIWTRISRTESGYTYHWATLQWQFFYEIFKTIRLVFNNNLCSWWDCEQSLQCSYFCFFLLIGMHLISLLISPLIQLSNVFSLYCLYKEKKCVPQKIVWLVQLKSANVIIWDFDDFSWAQRVMWLGVCCKDCSLLQFWLLTQSSEEELHFWILEL